MADNGELGPAPGGNGAGGDVGPTAHTGGADRITIAINNTEYQVDTPSMTGAGLKKLAKESMNRMVFWIKGGSNAGPGANDESVLDDQTVNLVSGMKFRIVNAGTFGMGAGPRRAGRPTPAAPRRAATPGGVQ